MKTRLDPRHKVRQEIVRSLFSLSFTDQPIHITKTAQILDNKNKVDEIIERIAPEFPIEKLNKIDLAILRLAVYELVFEKKEPPKVLIDEAIELAKEYGGDASPAFVNGALGRLVKEDIQKQDL